MTGFLNRLIVRGLFAAGRLAGLERACQRFLWFGRRLRFRIQRVIRRPAIRREWIYRERHRRINEVSSQGGVEIVFLGDSITQGWEKAGKAVWEKKWAPLKAVNFGIDGDLTEHVLWRVEHGNYDGLEPKLTVLMIGTNNTGHRMDSAAGAAAGIRAIVAKLREKQPGMKILVLGIFPRGANPEDPFRQRTAEINALIAPLADGKHVFFQDMDGVFLQPDGVLPKDIMPDFLHLSPAGYEKWAAAIEPKIRELTGNTGAATGMEAGDTP